MARLGVARYCLQAQDNDIASCTTRAHIELPVSNQVAVLTDRDANTDCGPNENVQ
eukprot:COSAG06_NODE_3182_length_5719_cov_58.908363_4_plen_55_part_00